MALLTEQKRKEYMEFLGYTYDEEGIGKLQNDYFTRKQDRDKKYGKNTDILLRHVYNVKKYTQNFEPQEFKCECGGKYCTGYPDYMKRTELENLQAIRSHYKKPMKITCGLRCRPYNNSLVGSIPNSLHLSGLATDFYMEGVTDTLANRKKSIKYMKTLPNFHYAYGNGFNSNGYAVSAPYMGNAIHIDSNDVASNVKADTEETKRKKYKVIDVSDWQGKINWKKVKADGVVGAIIRYADGDTLDARFDENMKNALAVGLHVGAYIYSRAKTKEQAEKEAKRLFNACKPYRLDMPLYIDLEQKGLEGYANTVAKAFMAKMDKLGARGGIYANLNWLSTYLVATIQKYGDRPIWIAQYNDKMEYKNPSVIGMWQYSSSGKVDGISGRVDMDECYIEYWKKPEPYHGKLPTMKLVKTNAEVIADAIAFGKMIAKNNDFHYGHGKDAHHNGCYFCGTNKAGGAKAKSGIKEYEKTYCCNPLIGAMWAHGGCIPKALALCQKQGSWDYSKGRGYDACNLFDKLGHPKMSALKPGDVLCNNHHVAMYIGNGKLIEACHEDDNKIGSASWNSSIAITNLTEKRYKGFDRVYRFNGSVNTEMPIRFGEISDRVEYMQTALSWLGYDISPDRIFGDNTKKVVKTFQKDHGLKDDGIAGKATIEAIAKEVKAA